MNDTVIDLLEANATHADAFASRFDDVQESQAPVAVSVCCSDSRVLQNHIWGNDEPGRIFTCANIGNRVIQQTDDGPVVSGDVLYPVAHTGTETVVVVGHTGCGAVTATYDALTDGISDLPGIEYSLGLLKPHLEPGVKALPDGLTRENAINHLVEYNVDRQVEVLLDSDDVPARVDVLGVVYDFQDIYDGKRGEIHVINADGERNTDILQGSFPRMSARVDRLWEY
jgi:carbonic anhydrase